MNVLLTITTDNDVQTFICEEGKPLIMNPEVLAETKTLKIEMKHNEN